MQTLGRIGATSRRMPAPASLPSLKSENAGNDPTVNLVPTGGSGWTNKKEDKENKAVNSEVRRLGPEKPPKSPGKKFKVDFPSLEEQEAMSKRELEELERRQREEQELREREGEEERERSPESGGGRPRGNWVFLLTFPFVCNGCYKSDSSCFNFSDPRLEGASPTTPSSRSPWSSTPTEHGAIPP